MKTLAILLVFLMVVPGIQNLIPQVRADTALVQETDKDFKNGQLGQALEVNGTGHDAGIKLAKSVNWRMASPSNNPGSMYLAPFAYDTDNGLAVLYDSSGKTWIYNASNETWTNANSINTPLYLYGSSMVYDQKDKVFITYSSRWSGSNYVPETWAYNRTNNTWFKRTTTGPSLYYPSYYSPGFVYDPVTSFVVLYGGMLTGSYAMTNQTWLYNYTANHWTGPLTPTLNPGLRYGMGSTYNPINKTVMIYGGSTQSGYSNDTWYYNASSNTWTKVIAKNLPPGCWSPTIVWDSKLNAVFQYGDYNTVNNYDNITRTFDPVTNTWTTLKPANNPGGGYGMSMVYNDRENIVMIFGGYFGATLGYSNKTWYYGDLFFGSAVYISGTFDSAPDQTTVDWISMSMSATLNGGNITYWVSANDDNISWDYVGWDGTVLTRYTQLGGQELWRGLDGHRYLRYELFIKSSDPLRSPLIGNVTVTFNRLPLAPVLKVPTHLKYVTTDTPTFTFGSQDLDQKDKLVYVLELSQDNFNTVFKTYDMTQSSTGWSQSSYAPGEEAAFTVPAADKLVNGQTYQWRATAFDGRDRSPVSVVWWFSVDTTPPEAPYSVSDGLGNDIAFTASTTTLSAHWDSAGDPESGIVGYWYAIGTTPGGSQVLNFTDNGIRTAVTVTGLTLTQGTTYYFSVKAENGAGLFSAVVTSDGQTVDTSGPTAPVVADNGNYTNSKTELSAQWFSRDPESGVAQNMYAIGTSAGATDVVNWTSIGGANTITHSGLNLVEGSTYFISVKSMNSIGIWSPVGSSDGITVDVSPPYAVTLSISGTNGYTNSNKVELSLSAKDNVSGVSEMQFSNDGSIWSSWASYAKNQEWTLSPGDGLKTVYVRVKDKASNEGAVVTASVILDTMAPSSLSIQANGGAAITNSTKVSLVFGATDLIAGVSDMALSENGLAWGDWMPYAAKMDYTLSADNGPRQIYLKVRDKAGNVAEPTNCSIMLDNVAPTDVTLVINDNDPITMDTQVTIKVTAKDATSGVNTMSFSDDGAVWTPWETFTSVKSWGLKGNNGVKTVWVRVMDKAGNIAPAAKDSIAYGESPMSLIITSPTKTSSVSGAVKISGSAKSDTPVTQVQVRIDGGVWKDATGTGNWTFDWNTKDYPDGIHTIEVQAKDSLGYTSSNPTEVRVKNTASKPVGLSTGDVVNFLILAIVVILVLVFIMFYVLSKKIQRPPEVDPVEHQHNNDYEAHEHPRTPPRQVAPTVRTPPKAPAPVVQRPAKNPSPPAQTSVTEEDKEDSGNLKSIMQKLDE